MARVELIFQGIQPVDHRDALQRLVGVADFDRFIASVAFVKVSGVAAIGDILRPIADRSTFYVGIRNGITSTQGIEELLNLGISVYAVDTARANLIFHPKLYLSIGRTTARAIVGSANATRGGLVENIEISGLFNLDLRSQDDNTFVEDCLTSLNAMRDGNPQHVFQITTVDMARNLLSQGRLVDEAVKIASPNAPLRAADRDDLEPMQTRKSATPPPDFRSPARIQGTVGRQPADPPPRAQGRNIIDVEWLLVWTSRELSERDLNIPSGPRTNPTGSMLLKKGLLGDDVDFRTYFRDEVFAELEWQADLNRASWERARANVELIVKGINYGPHELLVSNFMDQESRTFQQHNAMTQLHWGTTLDLIAKRDLLGRTLSLYKAIPADHDQPPRYRIEID